MSFAINMQSLRDRAMRRVETTATAANLLPNEGSKVARVATHAHVRKGGNPMLTAKQAERCHSPCWGDAEIQAFTDRRDRLLRWGYTAQVADGLAERLTLRDRDGDERRLCLECRELEATGRCAAARRGAFPGVDRGLEPVQDILMRCESFNEAVSAHRSSQGKDDANDHH